MSTASHICTQKYKRIASCYTRLVCLRACRCGATTKCVICHFRMTIYKIFWLHHISAHKNAKTFTIYSTRLTCLQSVFVVACVCIRACMLCVCVRCLCFLYMCQCQKHKRDHNLYEKDLFMKGRKKVGFVFATVWCSRINVLKLSFTITCRLPSSPKPLATVVLFGYLSGISHFFVFLWLLYAKILIPDI